MCVSTEKEAVAANVFIQFFESFKVCIQETQVPQLVWLGWTLKTSALFSVVWEAVLSEVATTMEKFSKVLLSISDLLCISVLYLLNMWKGFENAIKCHRLKVKVLKSIGIF